MKDNNEDFNNLSLLSISQVSKLLKIRHETVNKLIASGELGFIQINKRKKVPYKELQRFIDEKTVREKTEVKREHKFSLSMKKYESKTEGFDSRQLMNKILAKGKAKNPQLLKNK